MEQDKAYLIEEGGDIIPVTPINPTKGFECDELYKMLECRLVEVVELHDGRIMIMDEESKCVDNPIINKKATELYLQGRMTKEQHLQQLKEQYGDNVFDMSTGDDELDMSICGNVLVCPPNMFL